MKELRYLNVGLTEHDEACLTVIRVRYNLKSDTAAIRYALNELSRRDTDE